MTAPRPMRDGSQVGWGLMALIVTIYGVLVATIGGAIAWAWKRYQRT